MWILLEKLYKMGCYLALTIIIAREAGDIVLGSFFVVLAVSVVFSAVSAVGLNAVLIKDFAVCKGEGQVASLLLHSLFVRVSAAVIGGVLCCMIISLGLSFSPLVATLTGLLVLFSSHQVFDFFLESRSKFRTIFLYKSSAYTIGLSAKLTAVFCGASLNALLMGQIIEVVTLSGGAIWICRKNFQRALKSTLSLKTTRALIQRGFPLMLSSIAVIVYMKIDLPLLQLLSSASAAGQYASASRLCEALFILSIPILASIFPKMVSLNESRDREYFLYLRSAVILLMLLSSTLVLFSWFFSDTVVETFYGDGFGEASQVLRVYASALPLIFIGDIFSRWLVIKDLLSLSIIRHCFGLIVNILFNFLLIPAYGPVGAAFATVLGYFAATVTFILINRKARQFIFEVVFSGWANVR